MPASFLLFELYLCKDTYDWSGKHVWCRCLIFFCCCSFLLMTRIGNFSVDLSHFGQEVKVYSGKICGNLENQKNTMQYIRWWGINIIFSSGHYKSVHSLLNLHVLCLKQWRLLVSPMGCKLIKRMFRKTIKYNNSKIYCFWKYMYTHRLVVFFFQLSYWPTPTNGGNEWTFSKHRFTSIINFVHWCTNFIFDFNP